MNEQIAYCHVCKTKYNVLPGKPMYSPEHFKKGIKCNGSGRVLRLLSKGFRKAIIPMEDDDVRICGGISEGNLPGD